MDQKLNWKKCIWYKVKDSISSEFLGISKNLNFGKLCLNVSTTPLWILGFRQCLPFSWTTLRGKHCRHPIAVMGVVDTFGNCNLTYFSTHHFFVFKAVLFEKSVLMYIKMACVQYLYQVVTDLEYKDNFWTNIASSGHSVLWPIQAT